MMFLSFIQQKCVVHQKHFHTTEVTAFQTSTVELLGIEISLSAMFALYKGVTSLGSSHYNILNL